MRAAGLRMYGVGGSLSSDDHLWRRSKPKLWHYPLRAAVYSLIVSVFEAN